MVLIEKDEGQLELLRDRISVFPKGEKFLTQMPKAHPLAAGLEDYVMSFESKKVRYILCLSHCRSCETGTVIECLCATGQGQ